jgi:hypothetical protein
MERLKSEISKRMTNHYDFGSAKNFVREIPGESKLFSWLLLISPLIALLLVFAVRWTKKGSVEVFSPSSAFGRFFQKSPDDAASAKARKKSCRKGFSGLIVFSDLVFCAFCLVLFGLPAWRISADVPNRASESSYYGDSEFPDLRLLTPSSLNDCCLSYNDSFYLGTSDPAFFDRWILPMIEYSSGAVPTLEFDETVVENAPLLELLQAYYADGLLLSFSKKSRTVFLDRATEPGFFSKLRRDSKENGFPLGFWTKNFNVSANGKVATEISDAEAEACRSESERCRTTCCACYPSPEAFGPGGELLLAAGLLLLAAFLSGKRSPKLDLVLSLVAFLFFLGGLMQNLALDLKDVYGTKGPGGDFSASLRKCVTIYSVQQTVYATYVVLIVYFAGRTVLSYFVVIFGAALGKNKIKDVDRFS